MTWQSLFFGFFVSWVGLVFTVGCVRTSIPAANNAPTVHPGKNAAPIESILRADLRTLASCSKHLDELSLELQQFAKAAPWRKRGFFNAEEHDQIEHLLFRYLACRNALWHLAAYYRDGDPRFPANEAHAERSILAFDAGFRALYHDALLVQAFHGDRIAIAKLNEEFYRSDIPAGTYNRLAFEVTNEGRLKAFQNAFLLYSEELSRSDSDLARTVRGSSVYAGLVADTQAVVTKVDGVVQELVRSESRILPTLDNRIRHTLVVEFLDKSEVTTDDLLYSARAELFKGVSRLKDPDAHLIKFSDAQKAQVLQALRPGDIILTYTAGYMSDVFIPGAFKHAITYIGSVEDRRAVGLTAEHVTWLPQVERTRLLHAVATTTTPSGEQADVIEAVAEGVIFNHLAHLMDTHINRLVVLRPCIPPEERTKALANVFLFLGDGYDFKFNFADASEQVCTEVVYRALDGKGPINFTLVDRAGHPTLSADDIVHLHLASPGTTFTFVLLADEMPNSPDHQARILTGEAGAKRLVELMAAQKK